MGSYDGAETCELVGTFILAEISNLIPKENIGLYRDDGLAIISKPASIAESINKKLCGKFKQLGLQITATANSTVTDFLDVTFDLPKKEYRPYSKPGNTHLYVHVESNHPPIITKRIPQSIETRLSNISSNEEVFNNAKPEYENALHDAGHNVNLSHKPTNTNIQKPRTQQKERKRIITWFNAPYSKHVKTNIGRKFLALVDQHFPKEHELHKVCNRNTVKISYSCMDSMATVIKAHNNKITNHSDPTPDTCNCRRKKRVPSTGQMYYQEHNLRSNGNHPHPQRQENIHRSHSHNVQSETLNTQSELQAPRKKAPNRAQQTHLDTEGRRHPPHNNMESDQTRTTILTQNKTMQPLPMGEVPYLNSQQIYYFELKN